MAGVKLAVLPQAVHKAERHLAVFPRYRYDHDGATLYLDPALTLQETSHICDAVLEDAVSRSLDPTLMEPGPTG